MDITTFPLERQQKLLKVLCNRYALSFDGQVARMVELELYPWNDPFTHRNERQKERGTFYVHRAGKGRDDKYKGGTFKGIDFTCNGGVLIRSIEIDGEIIEGPCLVVNELCKRTGWDLAGLEQHLQMIRHQWPEKECRFGARAGLTLKRAGEDIEDWARHMVLPLRVATFVPKKYKETWYAVDPSRTDIPGRNGAKWKAEYEEGQKLELSAESTLLAIAGWVGR